MTTPEPEKPSVEELREQIEQTREELADTVTALAAKGDVKGRAQDKAADVSAKARVQAAQLSATAKEAAAHGSTLVRERTALVREKARANVPPAVRAQSKGILVAVAGISTIALGWLVRRRRS